MKTESTCETNELVLADLKVMDIVLIRTLNNVYEFLISDPAMSRGMVRGGAFGKDVVDALLICHPSKLQVGGRARLFTDSGDRCGFLTTSTITSLTHIKSY